MQALFDDRYEHVHGYRDPELRLDGVLRGAEETLDPQMLLDPFEEEFDLPATAVEFGDGERRQGELLVRKTKRLLVVGVNPKKRRKVKRSRI